MVVWFVTDKLTRANLTECHTGSVVWIDVCCNFKEIDEEKSYFEPYSMVSYGDVDVAYIGITTPHTISSSSPTQFRDENGEPLYTFSSTNLYDVVQDNIDLAKKAGAKVFIHIDNNPKHHMVGYALEYGLKKLFTDEA